MSNEDLDKTLRLSANTISNMLEVAYRNPVKFEERAHGVKEFARAYADMLGVSLGYQHISNLCRLVVMILNQTDELSAKSNYSILTLLGQAIGQAFNGDTEAHRSHIYQIVLVIENRFAQDLELI